MKEDRVLQALRALAEYDGERKAPARVEERLLRDFKTRRVRQRGRWVGLAALAAGVLIAAFLWTNRAPKPAVSAMPPVPRSVPPVIAIAQPATAPVAATVSRKVARKVATMHRAEPREVVTDFFLLMNPAPPFGRGQILRVQLPAAAMQTVGLPVREYNLADTIQADVLVGEEGRPRAIRFVRFDVQ